MAIIIMWPSIAIIMYNNNNEIIIILINNENNVVIMCGENMKKRNEINSE